MAGSFVRALYDYSSIQATDLNFKAGDKIKVLDYVDENWIKGKLRGNKGLFPSNFVEVLSNPSINDQAYSNVSTIPTTTVVANDTYISGEDGVLTFFVGDQLVFLERVDDYWSLGKLADDIGYFPSHLVNGLPSPSASTETSGNYQNLPNTRDSTVNQSTLIKESDVFVPSLSTPHARSLFNFEGVTKFELSFPAGEIIYITKDINDEWFEGNYNGIQGIFPKNFVEVLVPLPTDCNEGFEKINKDNIGHMESTKYEARNLEVPYAIAIYPFVGETLSDLSFKKGDIITLHNWVSAEWMQGECNGFVGIFPSTFVDVKVKLPHNFEDDVFLNHNVSNAEIRNTVFKIGDQAKASYSYSTGNEGDLCLDVGDIVRIEQVIDENWVLGKNDDNIGLCPVIILELVPAESFFSTYSDETEVSHMEEKSISLGHFNEEITEMFNVDTENDFVFDEKIDMKTIKRTSSLNDITAGDDNDSSISLSSVKKLKNAKVTDGLIDHGESEESITKDVTSLYSQTSTINISQSSNSLDSLTMKNTSANPFVSISSEPTVSPKLDVTEEPGKNWVTFENKPETSRLSKVLPKQHKHDKSLNSNVAISYKTLLEKSLEDDIFSSPPSIDDTGSPSTIDVAGATSNGDTLTTKLLEQAEEFENTSSRRNSLSLNEMIKTTMNGKPIPTKRHQGSAMSITKQGFLILDDLEEQIKKQMNELEKENQTLSNMNIVIEQTNDGTVVRQELESKREISEGKVEQLKRQLKMLKDRKNRLTKSLNGFSTQEEIVSKIQQLGTSIDENLETKQSLLKQLSENVERNVREEVEDNIKFCEDSIKNLTSELSALQDLKDELEGKVTKSDLHSMDVSRRKKVIDEILTTETSFRHDLNLCLKYFKEQLIQWKVNNVDCAILFGNMDEVANLSERLLRKLEVAVRDVDIMEQMIGTCFVGFSDEMTVVYGKYCSTHDEAIAFLEKSSDDEEIQNYFRKCLLSIRDLSNCWDLSSFLIKPVQRILKYPLLLNELLRNTPDQHPDKDGLVKAIEAMSIVANKVNEVKRRKELVQKYQKVEESGLTGMFQKFTWHSVVKKSSRINQKITQFTGLVSQTVDEAFNENEKLFHHIEKTAKNFVKNIVQYLDLFQNFHESHVQSCRNMIDFLKESYTQKNIQEYDTAQRYIGKELVSKLKKILDEEVLTPLNILLNLFQRPNRLIQKRHDKCLDFDSLSRKIEKIKDPEKRKQTKDEMDLAKKNYEALNTQLLDELPLLNQKSLKFLQTCITNFACVHKNFYREALDQFSPSVQLSLLNSGDKNIIRTFYSNSNVDSHAVFDIAFTPKKSLSISRPLQYSPSQEPVNGGTVKSRKLSSDLGRVRRNSLSLSTSGPGLVRSKTFGAADSRLVTKNDVKSGMSNTYIVKFSFLAEAPAELSVEKDNVVEVLQYHDASGQKEWWKCKYNGRTGFVPSSFLAPL